MNLAQNITVITAPVIDARHQRMEVILLRLDATGSWLGLAEHVFGDKKTGRPGRVDGLACEILFGGGLVTSSQKN